MGKVKSMKPYLLFGIGIAGASYLSSKDNRGKAKDALMLIKGKTMDVWYKWQSDGCNDLLEKAGNPDPYDEEDTRMVGEGATYSVDYYNQEVQQ